MAKFKVGDKVMWKSGEKAIAKVKEIYEKEISRKIKGKEITKRGTKDNPAYLVEQENGNIMLHTERELEKV